MKNMFDFQFDLFSGRGDGKGDEISKGGLFCSID